VTSPASTLVSGPELDTRRIAAAVVDVAVLAPVVAALYALAGGLSTAFVALSAAWALFYFFALESGDGQTVGKRLLGLRVVAADGAPADMRQVAVRTALRLADWAVGLVVMSATGRRRARLGDLAAGTLVADARGVVAAAEPAAARREAPAEAGPEAETADELAEPAHDEVDQATRFMSLGADAWAPIEAEVPAEEAEQVEDPLPAFEPVVVAEPETVAPEPDEEEEAPLLEPGWRPTLAEAPQADEAWRVVEADAPAPAGLDATDPELWMAAQRQAADAAGGEANDPAASEAPRPATETGTLVHPDEDEPRPFL
jgi:uncharacterized RDD family membrane protein YckC